MHIECVTLHASLLITDSLAIDIDPLVSDTRKKGDADLEK